MNTFKIALLIIGIIYGCLTIFAGTIQLKQRKISIQSSLSMVLGGLLLIASIVLSINISYTIFMLAISLLLIHITAIVNGLKMYGRINPRHHVIRLSISMLLIVLFVLR